MEYMRNSAGSVRQGAVLQTVLGLGLTVLIAAGLGLFFCGEHQATQLTVINVSATCAAVLLIDTV